MASILQHRVTVVTGAPGIGKTSLCQKAAEYGVQRGAFKDGAVFAALRGADSGEAQLFASLKGKQMLLVLDNAEAPIHAAQIEMRHLIGKLLSEKGVNLLFATRMTPALPRGVHEYDGGLCLTNFGIVYFMAWCGC